MSEQGKLNIYQRVNEIRKKVEYIKKDAEVQGYKAVTHDQVTAMVREHLIEYGVIVVAELSTPGEHIQAIEPYAQNVVEGTTNNGKFKLRYEGVFSVSFVNMDSPEDKITMLVPAHADDSGDKAPGKALSYATKYAILKLFSIETGESDESRLEGGRQYNALIIRTKEEAEGYIDCNDSLSLYLLSREVGQEVWVDVYNSAPDGKKAAFKKTLSEMEKQGHEVLKAINQAILKGDPLGAKENLDDVTDSGKRLLAKHLGAEKTKRLGELVAED